MPAAMALRAEENGATRAAIDPLNLLVLSILGGAFVSFGAIFATTVASGSFSFVAEGGAQASVAGPLPFGSLACSTKGIRLHRLLLPHLYFMMLDESRRAGGGLGQALGPK